MTDRGPRILDRLDTGGPAVDPHWDFERTGPGFDANARRFHRVRVAVPGAEPALVHVRLVRVDDGGEVELPPAEHLFRFLGGAARAAKSYAPVASPTLTADPPLLVLAIDVTHLGPGEHRLAADLPGSGRDPPSGRVTIARRPFHAFAVPPRAQLGAPQVRSAVGLVEASLREGPRMATAHVWRVVRHAWTMRGALTGAYEPAESVDVCAVTLFDRDLAPERTRWASLPRGERPDAALLSRLAGDELSSWRTPADHAREGEGFGLPFPTLLGLPSQPRPDGTHPPRR